MTDIEKAIVREGLEVAATLGVEWPQLALKWIAELEGKTTRLSAATMQPDGQWKMCPEGKEKT